MSGRQHQDNQQNFDDYRIAQAHCGIDKGFELRPGLRKNDSAFNKLPDGQPDPLVHHELRDQQQGQGHQKADVNIDVIKKGDFTCRRLAASPDSTDSTSNGSQENREMTITLRLTKLSVSVVSRARMNN